DIRRTGGESVRKPCGRAAKARGGTRLMYGEIDRGKARVAQSLEIHEIAGNADDGNRHGPVVLLRLGNGGRCNLFGIVVVDRLTVSGLRERRRSGLLGRCSDAGERGGEQKYR